MSATATKPGELLWIDERWHLDGRPIHAGTLLEILWPDGTWELVRIESDDRGRNLYAHFRHHGRSVSVLAHRPTWTGTLPMRWPAN